MRVNPPTLPLTKAVFAAALRTGHGRAIQQLASYGPIGLEDSIVAACITCLSYDPQCEAARAPWLYSVVDHAQLDATVLQAIGAIEHGLPGDSHRDVDQRSAILKEMAASGSNEARRLLYSSLARSPVSGDVIGLYDIVALDGVDGLIYVARQLGQWLHADPDFWVDGYLNSYLRADTGIDGGLKALEREASVDPDIARYLVGSRQARDSPSSSARFDATSFTAVQIVDLIQKNPKSQCHWLRTWGANASADQLEIVFAALVMSDEPEHVKRLFRCFAKVGTPRFESRLLRWFDYADEDVQFCAVAALAYVTHPELRQAARRFIAQGNVARGISLLVNNFEDGDFSMCTKHLPSPVDADDTHRLVGALLDLCEAHPGDAASDCLLYVYEFSPCSTCRCRAVKAMFRTNTAPAWVLEESAFDADPETRELVGGDHSFLNLKRP